MLEAAARQFGARIDVRWHAFELRPEPAPMPHPDGEYIREHWENRVLPMAAERGLVMRVPRRQVRSRRALQAALFAREHGRFADLDRALFRARFETDEDIADLDVLRRLGREAGLDEEALAYAVSSNAHIGELRDDLSLGHSLGLSGVPAMLVGPETADEAAFFGSAEPVIGAVPYDWLAAAIERALSGTPSPIRLRRR